MGLTVIYTGNMEITCHKTLHIRAYICEINHPVINGAYPIVRPINQSGMDKCCGCTLKWIISVVVWMLLISLRVIGLKGACKSSAFTVCRRGTNHIQKAGNKWNFGRGGLGSQRPPNKKPVTLRKLEYIFVILRNKGTLCCRSRINSRSDGNCYPCCCLFFRNL